MIKEDKKTYRKSSRPTFVRRLGFYSYMISMRFLNNSHATYIQVI